MNLLLDLVFFQFHFQQNQCHNGELKGKLVSTVILNMQVKTQGLILSLCINLERIPDETNGSLCVGEECWISKTYELWVSFFRFIQSST